MTQTVDQLKELYARDFVAWCENTATNLKVRQFDALDLDNLIEEIESLAKRDRRELQSRLDVLLNHLLKRCYRVIIPQEVYDEIMIGTHLIRYPILTKQNL